MLMNHDVRRPLDAVVLDAGVRSLDDGTKEVWARFDADADEWTDYQAELAAAGASGGFSFSCSEPLTVLESSGGAAGEVQLAADASYWSDDDLMAAAEQLRPLGTVFVGRRRYEFAFEPTALVVLFIVLNVGVGIVASAIYDGLKSLLRPDRRTTFQFRVTRDGDTFEAHLETDDPRILRAAINSLDQLSSSRRPSVHDQEADGWKPLRE